MALRTTVYLSNVTNLSDARYGAGMGVAYLGFPMDGENSIGTEVLEEIVSWVSGPELVMEFTDSSADTIRSLFAKCSPALVRVNDLQAASDLIGSGVGVIYNNVDATPLPAIELAAVISHDFISSEDTSHTYPILIAKDITTENLDNLLGHPHISGITLTGSSEIRPGYKDYDEIADILELLEVD